MLAGELGEVEARNARRVGIWLAVVTGELGQDLERLRLDLEFVVIGRERLRHEPCVLEFVVILIGKSDRERLDGLRHVLGHGRHNRA